MKTPRFSSGFRAFATGIVLALMGTMTSASESSRTMGAMTEMRDPAERDTAFLNEIEERALRFFREHTDERTGLAHDRAGANGEERNAVASIAATGFALTAWCIADARGWMSHEEAVARARTTLQFAAEHVAHEHGWYYHFLDAKSGRRAGDCEVSTIDTALFLSGALTAREYFDDAEVTRWTNAIYARIDWNWARDGGATLTHGWRPESGFIPWRWDRYAEMMGLYLLGIGAPVNPLPPETWKAWKREPVVSYAGRTFLEGGPLFTHQYAHAWFDFRGQRDGFTNYWRNSVEATFAHREWSAAQATRFTHWSRELWGLSASDSEHGYVAWGGSTEDAAERADGTLVPCAPAGSLPFAPEVCVTALRRMLDAGGPAVWRRYGFVDAFNPQTGWVAPDVIGIDLGITLVMAENTQSELVWRIFMKAPEVRLAMWLAGFRAEAPGPWEAAERRTRIAAK